MSSVICRFFLQNSPNSPRLARVARIHNFIPMSNGFLPCFHPCPGVCPCTAAGLLLSVMPMNAAQTHLSLDITALSHDGRGIARIAPSAPLAPTDGQSARSTVVFVANALPGQQVEARVLRRKPSFIEAEATALLREAPDAARPICPHHAECGGCPLQTMPYEQQLYWKRALVLDPLARIGGLDRRQLDAMLPPLVPSPALTRFRNKMEFAFGQDARNNDLVLGLRRRNGREITAVPHCALMPPEALRIVSLAGKLAAESGLPPFTAPDSRQGQSQPSPVNRGNSRGTGRGRQGRYPGPQQGRQHDSRQAAYRHAAHQYSTNGSDCADTGFWRFFVLRRGLAADMRTPRWWAVCITSPGNEDQRAAVRLLGREILSAFPQMAAFIHEERATADAYAFGEKRVQTLDAAGRENPAAARLFLPLAGMGFALDAASFFQVNTGGAQALARAAQGMLKPEASAHTASGPVARALLDLYCGVGAPGLLLARDYAALLGLEQDARAVQLAAVNAKANGIAHCTYEAGDAAHRLERLAALPPEARWQVAGPEADSMAATENIVTKAPVETPEETPVDALVDPPRAGLSPRALQALLHMAPERILYISCNPATLARDAAQLRGSYTLERLAAVDLFPHTPHIECLSLWRRAD